MLTINNSNLPLFIHQEEPLVVYVIDDKLIGCKEHFRCDRSYAKAFFLLYQMYNNPITRCVFPKKLQKYFNEKIDIENTLSDPLVGYPIYPDDPLCNLDLDILIQKNKEMSITLHNITYLDEPLNVQLKLSSLDAFYLFANICTNAGCKWIREFLSKKAITFFDVATLREGISEFDKEVTSIAYNFMLDYLLYLREQISNKTITLHSILRLSGARLLAFLAEFEQDIIPVITIFQQFSTQPNLTRNTKIMYYTFFEIFKFSMNSFKKDSSSTLEFNKIYSEKQQFIKEIEKVVLMRFSKKETLKLFP